MLDIDTDVLIDLNDKGLTFGQQADELGCSVSTISNRIAKIQAEQGILMKYRTLQSLQLTKIQAKILESITPEKIDEAPLRDLVFAFKVLKDKELVVEGKPNEIKGLVGYLIKMEKEQLALDDPEEFVEAEMTTEGTFEDPDYMPKL